MKNEREEYYLEYCKKLDNFIHERENIFTGEWLELAGFDTCKKAITSFKKSFEKYVSEGNSIHYSDKIASYDHDQEELFGKNLRPILHKICEGPEYFPSSYTGFTHNSETEKFYDHISRLLQEGKTLLEQAKFLTGNEKSSAQAIGQAAFDLASELKWEANLYFGISFRHPEEDFTHFKEKICKILNIQDKVFKHQTNSYLSYYLNKVTDVLFNVFIFNKPDYKALVSTINTDTLPALHTTIQQFEYKNSGVIILEMIEGVKHHPSHLELGVIPKYER